MLRTRENVGELDRRVTIQQQNTVKDIYNQDVDGAWVAFKTVWASVEDSTGSEQLLSDQITATRITTMTIRYLSGVTEMMRIVYAGRVYDIESIERPDRNRSLIIKTQVSDEPFVAEVSAFDNTFDPSF